MANYANLEGTITTYINTNGVQGITGQILQNVLKAMVESLGETYQFAGMATTSTNPNNPDENLIYLASAAGTYTNFKDSSNNALVVNSGEVALLVGSGTTWAKQSTGIATAAEVSQLAQKVNLNIDGEIPVDKAFIWSDGTINTSGVVATADTKEFCQPVLFHKGEKITYKDGSGQRYAVNAVADDTPITIGSSGFTPLIVYSAANTENSTTFDKDTYVVIVKTKANGVVTVTKEDLTLVPYTSIEEAPIGANILTSDMIFPGSTYLRRTDGITATSGGYGWTDFIEIPPEGLSCRGMLAASGSYAAPVIYYDADKKYVGHGTYTAVIPASTRKYVRFNLGSGNVYAVFKGTRVQAYSAPFTPGERISGGIIADNSIALGKMADVSSKNLIKNYYEGYYYDSATGRYMANALYAATDRIYVKPSTDYVAGSSLKSTESVILFDADGIVTRTMTTRQFTTTSAEVMAIVVFESLASQKYMLEEGTTASEYEAYKLQFNEDIIPNKELPDGSVTRDKIAPGVSLPGEPYPFNSFKASGTIATGETVPGDEILLSNKQILSAEILGTVEDVLVGVGFGSLYGAWLQITATQVKVIYGTSSTVDATYNHGLTLGSRTKVVFTMDGDSKTFRIIGDAGDSYSNTMRQFVGAPFVTNNGSTSLEVAFSYNSRVADARIWCAGDSYWSFGDPARIPSKLKTLGAEQFLAVALGGASAQKILPSITALLNAGGRPSYIVWALGMNGGTDSAGQVNSNWLTATTTFLTMCEGAGITPILCTIPTVPSYAHDALNAWIRNSGYRYIDVADEVEQSGTTYWRGWGTANALLSNDEVHPTAAGAMQIAARIIVDFPEITQLNP